MAIVVATSRRDKNMGIDKIYEHISMARAAKRLSSPQTYPLKQILYYKENIIFCGSGSGSGSGSSR